VKSGDTLGGIARRYYGTTTRWPTIWNANRNRLWRPASLLAGDCIWVRRVSEARLPSHQCTGVGVITGQPTDETIRAARTLGVDWYNLTTTKLLSKTDREVSRARAPNPLETVVYVVRTTDFDLLASATILAGGGYADRKVANMLLVVDNSILPGDFGAVTIGHTVFIRRSRLDDYPLLGHEYIHTLQEENGGWFTALSYGIDKFILQEGSGPENPNEAIGYLWEGWLRRFGRFGERPPWCYYEPLFGGTKPQCR
jgi:hypothetical protein